MHPAASEGTTPGRSSALARGSAATLAGIVVSGIGGLGSLVIATRAVATAERGALAATWTLVFLVGPAVFFPLEQALAARLLGGTAPRARRVALVAASLVAAIGLAGTAAAPWYLDALLDGQGWLLVAVVGSLAGYAAQHVLRATLVARGAFGRYAVVLGLDGALRLAGCAAAALAGASSPEPYALAVGAAPLVATLAVAAGARGAGAGLGAGGAGLGAETVRLVAASVCANVVAGAGPAVLKLLLARAPDPALVASYLVTVSLTRIPLLLGQATLAPLMNGLASALAAGRDAEYRRLLRGAVVAVAGAGAVTAAAFALAAPALVPVVFGAGNGRLGAVETGVLALCAVTFLLGQVLTQALAARGRSGRAALGWAAGVAVAAAVLAFWPGTLGRVLAATLAGCVAAVLALAPAAR